MDPCPSAILLPEVWRWGGARCGNLTYLMSFSTPSSSSSRRERGRPSASGPYCAPWSPQKTWLGSSASPWNCPPLTKVRGVTAGWSSSLPAATGSGQDSVPSTTAPRPWLAGQAAQGKCLALFLWWVFSSRLWPAALVFSFCNLKTINQVLIPSICPFPRYKLSHHGQFQVTNVMSLNTELGRDGHGTLDCIPDTQMQLIQKTSRV